MRGFTGRSSASGPSLWLASAAAALLAAAARAEEPAAKPPARLLAELGFERFRCDQPQVDALWPPGSTKPLTVSTDGRVREWDVATGRITWEHALFSPGDAPHAFSRDGRLAAWLKDGKGFLQPLRDGEPVELKDLSIGRAAVLVFSLDGSRVAAADKHGFQAWDTKSGERIGWSQKGEPADVTGLAFSTDGASLLIAREAVGITRAAVRGDSVPERVDLPGLAPGPLLALGSAVALTFQGEPGAIHVHDLATRTTRVLPGSEDWSSQGVLSADGTRYAAENGMGVFRVWNPASSAEAREIETGCAWVSTFAISPDGKRVVAIGHASYVAAVIDLETGRADPGSDEEVAPFDELAVSPDGRTLAALSVTGAVTGWDLETRQRLFRTPTWMAGPEDFRFSADGTRLLASFQGAYGEPSVEILDGRTGKPLGRRPNEHGTVAFSPDGKRFARIGGMHVSVCDAREFKDEVLLATPYVRHQALEFSRDSKSLFLVGALRDDPDDSGACLDWELLRLSAATGGAEGAPLPLARLVCASALSPDQRLIALRLPKSTRVVDARSGVPVFDLKEPSKWIRESSTMGEFEGDVTGEVFVAWSADGRYLAATRRPGKVDVFEVATARRVLTLDGIPRRFAWIPGTMTIAGAAETGGRVQIWDATPPPAPAAPAGTPLLENAWDDLGRRRGSAARRAATALGRGGDAARDFLEGKLRVVEAPRPEVDALLARLSGDVPADRDAAEEALRALGVRAEPRLRAAAAAAPDAESKARISALLMPLLDPVARTADQRRADWVVRLHEEQGAVEALRRLAAEGFPGRLRAASEEALLRLKENR